MEIFKMERSAFILFHFVGLSLFSETVTGSLHEKVLVKIANNKVPLKMTCQLKSVTIRDKAKIWCPVFWKQHGFLRISGNMNVSAEKVVFEQKGKPLHEEKFVKSFRNAVFMFTHEGAIDWKVTIKTANRSANVLGRIHFSTNCHTSVSLASLANSFDNFTPGKTDVITIKTPDIKDDHYCVVIQDSVSEDWFLNSITLLNERTKKQYTFDHGEKMFWQRYNRYQGNRPFFWTVNVVTGNIGMDGGLDINFKGLKCHTLITLDNKFDNFMVNSSDLFEARAEDCGQLESIQLNCQQECHWIMKHITVTAKSDPALNYTFTHGESLIGNQTFFISQASGPNKWEVRVCTRTSTDEEIYLKLDGKKASTAKLRLTTPEDDFEAGQCNNFTLSLQDIGDLQKIHLVKPNKLVVNKLLFSHGKIDYKFHLLGAYKNAYTMVAYRTGFLSQTLNKIHDDFDLGDNFTVIGIAVKPETKLEAHVGRDINFQRRTTDICFRQTLVKDYKPCGRPIKGHFIGITQDTFPTNIELRVRPEPGKTIWYLTVQLPWAVSNVYVRLEDDKLSTFISYVSTMTKSISTHFYTEDILFSNADTLTLITEPSNITCASISVQLDRVKNNETKTGIPNAIKSFKCGWKFNVAYVSTTTNVPKTTSSTKTTASTIKTVTRPTTGGKTPTSHGSPLASMPTATATATAIETASTENSVTNTSLVDGTGYPVSGPVEDTTAVNTTVSNSTATDVSTSVSSIADVSTTHRGGGGGGGGGPANKTTRCSCNCPKMNFTQAEMDARMKELVKELKVNRNETSSYLRSKKSAPDERVSSQVIGSTAVIIMSIPFGLIVLVDLIPLFHFIYKKVISLM